MKSKSWLPAEGAWGRAGFSRESGGWKRDRLPRKHHSSLIENPETVRTSARFVSFIQMNREMGSRLKIWDLLALPSSQIPSSRLSDAPGQPKSLDGTVAVQY